jgi:hypothetical protein
VSSVYKEVSVENYAGYKGEETPRVIVLEGIRHEVVSVLSRKRSLDLAGGGLRDIWRCRLEDGRVVIVERLESGSWRARAAS